MVTLLLRRYDSDSDGRLQYADFCKLLSPKDAPNLVRVPSLRPANREQPFSAATTELLASVINLHIECEVEAEELRKMVHRRHDLNLYSVFLDFDGDKDGYLASSDLKAALMSQEKNATEKELRGLVRRYDSDKDGQVSYIEFVEEVTPKSPPSKRN
jgi:Ca2+-binding EF-hand superfamily protein